MVPEEVLLTLLITRSSCIKEGEEAVAEAEFHPVHTETLACP